MPALSCHFHCGEEEQSDEDAEEDGRNFQARRVSWSAHLGDVAAQTVRN